MLLEIQNISKSFEEEPVLQSISFSLQEKNTLSILGKSGCGKTTLLKIIAGLIIADEGNIFLNNQSINNLPARERNIVYMSQEALLFPHLNIFENIAFGLRVRKQNNTLIKQKINQLVEELGLNDHIYKMPDQLSGGQKQRVNFGRALIVKPPLLLLDEPFGNLDTQTRGEMQMLFQDVVKEHFITSIFVTHDLKEALLVGDEIGFMQNGNLKTYADKNSFISDSRTGVQQEIEFWKSLII